MDTNLNQAVADSNYQNEEICTILSGSTGETVPNLPGTGRILGLAYDAGGRVLEKYLNRAGQALGIAPRAPGTVEWYASMDELATVENQPGAGRTLDLLITAGGRKLERSLNKLALRHGLGPEAAMRRISRHMSSFKKAENPGTQWNFLLCESFDDRYSFVKDCKRLVKYAQSVDEATRRMALEHIISLSSQHESLRFTFNQMGATDKILRYVDCGSEHCVAHTDPLLKYSRRALLSLSESRVHTISHQLQLSRNDELVQLLFRCLRDDTSSFLALRHLNSLTTQNPWVSTFHTREMSATVCEELRLLVTGNADAVEWSILDELLRSILLRTHTFWAYSNPVHLSNFFIVAMPILIRIIIQNATSVPISCARLAESMYYHAPCTFHKGSCTFPLCFLRVALFRGITFDLLDSMPGRAKAVEALGITLQHKPSLKVDIILTHLLLSRSYILDQQYLPYSMDRVVLKENNYLLANLADAFLDCLYQLEKRPWIIRYLRVLRNLDKYCWDTFAARFQEFFTEFEVVDGASLLRDFWMIANHRPMLKGGISGKQPAVFRVFHPESGRHHYCQVSDYDVYPFTKKRKSWRWWPPLPVLPSESEGYLLHVEELTDATPDFVLLLSVPVGEPFKISDHHPIYAGDNAHGDEEYLAVGSNPIGGEIAPLCCVSDGDTTVQFWDSSGREVQVTEFRAFVLAFAPEAYLLATDGGVNNDTVDESDSNEDEDCTGPVRWAYWGEIDHLPDKPLLVGIDDFDSGDDGAPQAEPMSH